MRARIPPYPALSRYLPQIENGKLGHYLRFRSLEDLTRHKYRAAQRD
jgi:hypothetical protein